MNTTSHNAKIRKFAETAIKILIVLAGCWILYVKIIKNQDLTEMWESVKTSFSSTINVLLMALAFILMPLNMALETRKWQKSIQPVERVPFWKAYTAIFTGITAGMMFPNRTGDFLGRIFILEKGNRLKAAMLTFVGNIAQMLVTVSLGCIAWIFFTHEKYYWYVLILSLIIIVLGYLLYFNIHILKHLQRLIPKKWRPRAEKYMEIFGSYSKKDLAVILLIAFAKYAVYSLQFVILIWAFDVPLNYLEAMVPIMLTYLLMTVIPFITITEIAVRGSVCIYVFEAWLTRLGISAAFSMMVFSASTMLWLYNLAIPAIIGLFFIRKLKFIRSSYES
ncbi:MAG: flippase-like domain-containing protein [Bacteroidales bacterium]|nr:flippase-like domain-containing protein [Bacteroidales bacterium]